MPGRNARGRIPLGYPLDRAAFHDRLKDSLYCWWRFRARRRPGDRRHSVSITGGRVGLLKGDIESLFLWGGEAAGLNVIDVPEAKPLIIHMLSPLRKSVPKPNRASRPLYLADIHEAREPEVGRKQELRDRFYRDEPSELLKTKASLRFVPPKRTELEGYEPKNKGSEARPASFPRRACEAVLPYRPHGARRSREGRAMPMPLWVSASQSLDRHGPRMVT